MIQEAPLSIGLKVDSLVTTPPIETRALTREQLEACLEKVPAYKKVCVFGLGYVGLPTALLFSRQGFEVHGVDVSERVMKILANDEVPDVYPELNDWWQHVRENNHFTYSEKPVESDLFLIAVPTPVNSKTKRCDLSYVKAAGEAIAEVLKKDDIVVLESTVPPGTTSDILRPMLEKTGLKAGVDFHLCFSPERVLPGNTVHELQNNARIIGGTTRESAELCKAIFEKAIKGDIYATDDRTAEFCKIAENTARDVNIALANELSILADDYGIDIKEAIELINQHPRVKLLNPGIGVGGHCIAVDPWFFVEASPEHAKLINQARRVNDSMPAYSVQKIIKDVEGIRNPKIVLVGLTYKPDVADTRESPAIEMVEILKRKDFNVVEYDPLLPEYEDTDLISVAKDADYMGILVLHTCVANELRENMDAIQQVMNTPNIHVF